MKRVSIPLLAIMLVTAVIVPPANAQWGRGWHGRGGSGERHEFHRGGGCVGCGFLGGLILGGVLAAPYYAPPPTRYTQPGYWPQIPYTSPGGYTTFQNVWVPSQTICQ